MSVKVGIEFELEKHLGPIQRSPMVAKYWAVTGDGSLMDGQEYVLKGPLDGEELERSLWCFEAAAHPRLSDHASPRCSMHVHLDIRGLNRTQLMNFVGVSAILDTTLSYLTHNEHRSQDVFCVPLVFGEENPLLTIQQPLPIGKRYTSISLSPLRKLGSVEFRHFSIPDSMEEARYIIQLLQSIWEWSTSNYTDEVMPNELLANLSGKGSKGFIQEIAGDNPIVNDPKIDWVYVDKLLFDSVSVVQIWVDELREAKEKVPRKRNIDAVDPIENRRDELFAKWLADRLRQ